MTSRSDDLAEFFKMRPRDRIYTVTMEEIFDLELKAKAACREPTCGAREDGEIVSCASVNCGEKLMLDGYRRKLQVKRDIKLLVEGLERAEMERQFAEEKSSWGKKR